MFYNNISFFSVSLNNVTIIIIIIIITIFQSPLLPQPGNSTFQRENDVATNTTQTLSGDSLIGEVERVIEKEKLK